MGEEPESEGSGSGKGDPEKGQESFPGVPEGQSAKLKVPEKQPSYPCDPIVACTLAPVDGDLQETLFGRYWSHAVSEALRQVAFPVADDRPLISQDGKAYLWGTYSEGEATTLELFTGAIPHE